MPEESFTTYTQLFQQSIATVLACRTLLKYNSTLSPEQQEEIFQEIDKTVDFLEKRLGVYTAFEANDALSPHKLADLVSASIEEQDDLPEEPQAENQGQDQEQEQEQAIRGLYKLYTAYFGKSKRGEENLELRYKEAMAVIDQLQSILQQQHTIDPTMSESLQRIRGYSTSIYWMLREFAFQLGNIVQGGRGLETDTETLLEKYQPGQQSLLRDITPLLRVYGAHLQLQGRRGRLSDISQETSMFLLFLTQILDKGMDRREEIVAQLQTAVEVLGESIRLLTDYEQAITTVIQQPPSA